ncbi:site-specific tyrosine recombinase/integron integrase [Methanomethylophilus alvi]|uniref:site-specific tyrosine recombinase/integron integrase n=1 Tax=Methanomethylophilus alvi TaxID=1291540 RepID=UPI0037DD66F0
MAIDLIVEIEQRMSKHLDNRQLQQLHDVLSSCITERYVPSGIDYHLSDLQLIDAFISAKRVEGCSERTLGYYGSTINNVVRAIGKPIRQILTDDLRIYLASYQQDRKVSKITIDNVRRIMSSFYSWLEDEDHIIKSPVRRIKKVRVSKMVKEVYSDEELEKLRDDCHNIRDLAMIDILASTGMRVGELVKLDREDIDFQNRECIVLGKGDKERPVYFDARTKVHLQTYLNSRTDDNPALFVTLDSPHDRLKISGVEIRLHNLGRRLNIHRVHPHKFRRTLATRAIDKGMPIEQVQHLLGHQKIDTTLEYAMVNQSNVKASHRKYIG